tara:strand:+ start:520 stop:750 length:231 start_codon:yes stop_codon:yes gene_type:complete
MSGGRDSGEGSGAKKGKAKMSQAEWDKLSSKQRDVDYGGSRFMQAGSSGSAKEAGHKSGKEHQAAGRGSRGRAGIR